MCRLKYHSNQYRDSLPYVYKVEIFKRYYNVNHKIFFNKMFIDTIKVSDIHKCININQSKFSIYRFKIYNCNARRFIMDVGNIHVQFINCDIKRLYVIPMFNTFAKSKLLYISEKEKQGITISYYKNKNAIFYYNEDSKNCNLSYMLGLSL